MTDASVRQLSERRQRHLSAAIQLGGTAREADLRGPRGIPERAALAATLDFGPAPPPGETRGHRVMRVTRQDLGSVVLVIVTGEVTLHTSPDLRQVLVRALDDGSDLLVVDLEAVNFMDTSGVATLIEACQGVLDYGGRLRLLRPSRTVRKLLDLLNLTAAFDIRTSRKEALDP